MATEAVPIRSGRPLSFCMPGMLVLQGLHGVHDEEQPRAEPYA